MQRISSTSSTTIPSSRLVSISEDLFSNTLRLDSPIRSHHQGGLPYSWGVNGYARVRGSCCGRSPGMR